MAEDKVKHIHIEDGDAETGCSGQNDPEEGVKEDGAGAAECSEEKAAGREEDTRAEEHRDQTEEPAADKPEDKADGKQADEKKAEEQESERYMRLMAEFQNFKRRAAKEKTDIHAYANEKLVGELLPVLDNFERALETGSSDAESFAKGMDLIFQQLRTALEHAGLAEIKALGEDFDPNVHNAVMTEQSEELEDGKVSKAGAEVKEGDVMEIRFGNRVGRYQITDVREVVRKENAAEMYKVLEESPEIAAERG